MRRLSVREYESEPIVGLTEQTVQALRQTRLIAVTPGWQAGSVVAQASKYVGVQRVGTGGHQVEVQVAPKVGVARLVWLLSHARNQDGWLDQDVDLHTVQDLLPAMAVIYAARLHRALLQGVLHGYREYDDTSATLRGRLREADQMRARPGLAFPLEVCYDDYTPDITENQILRTAAIRLLELPGIPVASRVELARADRALADVSVLNRGLKPPRVHVTRLNRRYEPALHVAQLILQHLSVETIGPASIGSGFVFDMNAVFQDWLEAAFTHAFAAHGGGILRQQPLHIDQRPNAAMATDITWHHGQRCVALIDAKYKHLSAGGPRPEDLYQMISYATALDLKDAHLVYASGGPERTLRISHSDIRIHAHVTELAQPRHELLAAVARLANTISNAVDHPKSRQQQAS